MALFSKRWRLRAGTCMNFKKSESDKSTTSDLRLEIKKGWYSR